ncbi:hypothetical protein [Methylotuvimicrobium sp. KM2]|uniref:hypothetical protein n=1 Tax=Methylotuvimicrobium sp. KM2 TaxID=3133976 RepID=UPI0031014A07
MKRLVPAQGDGTRPNEVSAAIPGGEAAGNAEVTGAGAQRRVPKAARFWRPVDRLVM